MNNMNKHIEKAPEFPLNIENIENKVNTGILQQTTRTLYV